MRPCSLVVETKNWVSERRRKLVWHGQRCVLTLGDPPILISKKTTGRSDMVVDTMETCGKPQDEDFKMQNQQQDHAILDGGGIGLVARERLCVW